MDWIALQVSFKLAFATSLLLLPIALLIAYPSAYRVKNRLQVFWEALLMLPLLLPPTVIGFILLWVLSPQSTIGRLLQEWFSVSLVFRFEGLLLASMLINLPLMVQPIERALTNIPISLREAAWVSGLSRWQTWLQIELPLAWPGIASGLALTFAHTLGEFGVVLMLGGSIEGETRTLSIAIYERVQTLQFVQAASMSLLLIFVSVIIMALLLSWSHKKHHGLAEL